MSTCSKVYLVQSRSTEALVAMASHLVPNGLVASQSFLSAKAFRTVLQHYNTNNEHIMACCMQVAGHTAMLLGATVTPYECVSCVLMCASDQVLGAVSYRLRVIYSFCKPCVVGVTWTNILLTIRCNCKQPAWQVCLGACRYDQPPLIVPKPDTSIDAHLVIYSTRLAIDPFILPVCEPIGKRSESYCVST